MRIIAHIAPGPNWLPGRSVYEQGEPVRDHLRFMQARFDDGSLLLGGPARDGLSGLAVLEVPDVEAAQAFAAADPGVAADVLVYEIRELVPFFDALVSRRGVQADTDHVSALQTAPREP
jgi:uncharacterized protein YciI